ncbi:MAG: hotdog domain-containing protein [Thermoanaerobaculia bacterium]
MSDRVLLRLRVGAEQAHYGGGLVDGAFVLKLFGDAATELLIRRDGDEGLFRAYSSVDFLAPVRGGDYLEVEAELTRVGKTSREMRFEARKVIAPQEGSSARVLEPPQVVARASGTCVVPLEKQRSRA